MGGGARGRWGGWGTQGAPGEGGFDLRGREKKRKVRDGLQGGGVVRIIVKETREGRGDWEKEKKHIKVRITKRYDSFKRGTKHRHAVTIAAPHEGPTSARAPFGPTRQWIEPRHTGLTVASKRP